MPTIAPVEDGPWQKGVDSYMEPTQVQKNFFRWGVNVSNRGGVVRTRPGFSCIPARTTGNTPLVGQPRGITTWDDKSGVTHLVIAIGKSIYYLPYPFKGPFVKISALTFAGDGPVVFVRCIVSVTEDANGNIRDVEPFPILLIQDGASRAGYWIGGQSARHLDSTKKVDGGPSETPVGLWGAWSGNRYWVSNGSRMRASNLLNPLKFTEEDLLAEGGFLQFPGPISGVTNTFDFTSLLVFTDVTTSTLLTSLLDRTKWAATDGFQKVVFSGIGCAGGNAIATQWGMVWWYTHDGLIGLDEGLRAFQSSKVTYRDREMSWSKANISTGFEDNIAMGAFENLLFVSVPSGDMFNAHTWVMDEAPLDVLTYWGYFGLAAWSGIWEGIRPVGWVTAHIKGHKRCFCLSQDYPMTNNVWEVGGLTRMDKSVDCDFNPVINPIKCTFETKLLGYDGNYKFFRFAEIYLDNVEGEVDLTVSYAGRRGGWKKILQKHIVSTDFVMVNTDTHFRTEDFIFDPLRPQQRAVRTVSEAKTYDIPKSGDDNYTGVQTGGSTPYPRQKDYAFSLLLEWTGRMSISSVRVYFDPEEQETEGVVEVNEDTNRLVDMAGFNVLVPDTLTPYVIDPLSMDFRSHVLTGSAPLWIDPLYDSMNGIVCPSWQLAGAGGGGGGGITVPSPTGACCIDGVCSIMTEAACIAAGGTYMGNGIPCDPNPCGSAAPEICCPTLIHLEGSLQAFTSIVGASGENPQAIVAVTGGNAVPDAGCTGIFPFDSGCFGLKSPDNVCRSGIRVQSPTGASPGSSGPVVTDYFALTANLSFHGDHWELQIQGQWEFDVSGGGGISTGWAANGPTITIPGSDPAGHWFGYFSDGGSTFTYDITIESSCSTPFIIPSAVTNIAFSGITVCPGCIRLKQPFYGSDRSINSLTDLSVNMSIPLLPFFGGEPWSGNSGPGGSTQVISCNRFDGSFDCTGTSFVKTSPGSATVACTYNSHRGYTIFYTVNILGVGSGGSGFDGLLFYAVTDSLSGGVANQIGFCGQVIPAGQGVGSVPVANYIAIATGGIATLTITP